jgi:NADH:ubiquinone oxidoreductase subunit 5 (subunit L)/multisubunit Na+/H+ antiporter MnhA subunit
MSKKHSSWMISPKSFIRAMGADYELMHQAGGTVLIKFYIASITIFLIAIISFLSIKYAVAQLFHSTLMEILLSVFLSLLFVLMYIFLINTFTKQNLQDDKPLKQHYERKDLLTFSNISRTVFVVIMGFIISKPIEVFLYKDKLTEKIEIYRAGIITNHDKKITILYSQDIEKLNKKKQILEQLNSDKSLNNEIMGVDLQLQTIEADKKDLIARAIKTINKSSFFTYQIQQTSNSYILSWAICLGIILFFLLPGYLIYSISRDDDYFSIKRNRDRSIIQIEYQAFLEKYRQIFRQKFGYEVDFYTVYLDPPFEKNRKPKYEYKTSKDFFTKYGVD